MLVNVVIGIVEKEKKILLIQRKRGDFVGLWGLPGGKIEDKEHIPEAIQREIEEETGMKTKFEKLLGTCTEIMHDTGNTSILNCCLLSIEENTKVSEEAELEHHWFSEEDIRQEKNIIESDLVFIKTFYQQRKTNYLALDCYREENGTYYWE